MQEGMIWKNGNIITMEANHPQAQAVAIDGERLVRVGRDEDLDDLAAAGWKVVDLKGKTVIPGFIDCHQHLMLTGLQAAGMPLAEATCLDDVLQMVAERAATLPKGSWIKGGGLDEQEILEQRMPTRADLDRVSPAHPVFILHSSCHLCSLNSLALERLSPPPDLEGMDTEGGAPTGVVRDPGILTFVHPAMSRLTTLEEKLAAMQAAARLALQKGITTLHCLDGGDFGPGDTRIIWKHRDQLPVHILCYNQSMNLEEVRELGLSRVGGCICADGAFEAHTAALFEPYHDDPDNYGTLTFTQEEMDQFVLAAHREGLQIAVHCESDRSIEQVLWAMEKALRAYPRSDHRHRIEHFELPTPNQIDRLARAGIIASMQPAFIPAFIGVVVMDRYEQLLGRPRLAWLHPYRTILDQGIPICGGSDSPVTPYGPLVGIQAAVNHPNPEQRVSRLEALAMFTSAAAYSGFEEKDKGSIEPGKLADLVVLDRDPLSVPVEEIAAIQVEMVLVAGRKVFSQAAGMD